MKHRLGVQAGIVMAVLSIGLAATLGQATDISKEVAVKYLLVTVKAFRTVYIEDVIEHVKKAGIHPTEDWLQNDHAIMLPFQFVKLGAVEIKDDIKDLEVGLISLTPIYTSNLPKTQAEVDALQKMMADPRHQVLTFADGDQFKGLAADFAIEQDCADCHNHHPKSPKKDFKKGDVIGAIVVRLKK